MNTVLDTPLSPLVLAQRPVPLFELVGSLSSAMDLISPAVNDHHTRVAAIALSLGEAMGLDELDLADLVFSALVHDIGAFALSTRLDALEFETDTVQHALVGRQLLASFPGFLHIADVVGRHHTRFDQAGEPREAADQLAGIIHLADRIDVDLRAARTERSPSDILGRVRGHSGSMFHPDHVRAFEALAGEPGFWRSLATDPRARLKRAAQAADRTLTMEETAHFSELISRIIDFRSRFTATHSRGVAAGAEHLARLMGMDQHDCLTMYTAGNLHDLGKLAVPKRLLEKPAALTDDEFDTMRQHALYSLHILSAVPGLEQVALWAGNHHERLDGRGYPRGNGSEHLDQGSRIMAVADVFTALAEDRPYRAGMSPDQAAAVLTSMAREKSVDPETVDVLLSNYADLNRTRVLAQSVALDDFRRFEARV